MKKRVHSPIFWTVLGMVFGIALVAMSLIRGGGILPAHMGTGQAVAADAAIRTSAGRPSHPALDYAAMDARLRRLAADPDMAGMAVAIVDDGRIAFAKGYGVANRETGEPVTPDTVFRWASLSKGAASALAYRLAEKGELSLARPLSDFRTSLRLPDGAERRLNLTDLLAHRVGITHNAYDEKLERGMDPAMLRRTLAAVPLQCEPGQCYSYQNIAYDTLSEIVPDVTGRLLPDQVGEELFVPLGMASAGYGIGNLTRAESWARPYRRDRLYELSPSYFKVPAAAGVSSNIVDLARWMQAQMGEQPKILSEAVLYELHRPRVATDRRGRGALAQLVAMPSYGQGWRSMLYDGHGIVHHQGAVNGYRAAILFDPVLRSGIVMMWNSSTTRPFKLQYEFLDQLYGRPHTDWLELDDLPENAVLAGSTAAD
ncbi:MAG: serine hydrolase domain-containing protein [Blastomonas sp.]